MHRRHDLHDGQGYLIYGPCGQVGRLVIDYAIDLHHNGVVNYGNTNIINGATVTDAAGIVQATTGRSPRSGRTRS